MKNLLLDLLEYPVVDSHCHAFIPEPLRKESERKPFEQYLTLATHKIPKEDIINTFIYRKIVRELSRVLDIKGTYEEIVNERIKRYKQDPLKYIKLLFEDANIKFLLVDTGGPSKITTLKDFSKIIPCEVREIVRIEDFVRDFMENQLSFDEAIEQYHKQIKDSMNKGAVGLKSIVAYRTGLEVQRTIENDARKAYMEFIAEIKTGKSVREILSTRTKNVKSLSDYFVFLGIEDSVKFNVPFQIHTGIGDAPFDLRNGNPLLLHNLINDKSSKDAKIVLTHGGYPYIEEAGYLVNSYPNLFLDLSETIPFISIGIREKLLNLFEMAPTNKIMYGSDGYNIPELFWISSIQTKRDLSTTLNGLLKSKEIDEEQAFEIAKQFLSDNAKRIYDL